MKKLKKYLIWIWVFIFVLVNVYACISLIDKKRVDTFVEEDTPIEVFNDEEDYELELDRLKDEALKRTCEADCIYKILKKRTDLGDENFSVGDAHNLYRKISYYSEKYNILIKDALVIVNVESDFKTDAYNERGKAYGLTQITSPCLKEYNNVNGTNYKLENMFDIDLNLEVGFWYYSRLMKHYSKFNEYGITLTSDTTALRDSYIAYNIGVTEFKNAGRDGRNQLRNGVYPRNMHGYKKGTPYKPITRYYKIVEEWS